MKRERAARPTLANAIARREYRLVTRSGTTGKVLLRFGEPSRIDADEYACDSVIEGLEEGEGAARTRRIFGVDSLQALHLAMQLADAELVSTQAYREGRLTWEGSSDLGLPAIEADRNRGRPARNKARGTKRR